VSVVPTVQVREASGGWFLDGGKRGAVKISWIFWWRLWQAWDM